MKKVRLPPFIPLSPLHPSYSTLFFPNPPSLLGELLLLPSLPLPSGIIMAFQKDGKMYIKLNASGESNSYDKIWDDGVVGQIKQILLWHDKYFISGLQIVYESKGKNLISKRHGGTQGNFEMIEPKKPLTWLSGHYGSECLDPELLVALDEEDNPWNFRKRIFSLKFGNKEETYGPYGCEKGTANFFFRGTNEIVGFHGFGTESTTPQFDYVSAIGLYIKIEADGFVGQSSNPNESVDQTIEDENKPELIMSGN